MATLFSIANLFICRYEAFGLTVSWLLAWVLPFRTWAFGCKTSEEVGTDFAMLLRLQVIEAMNCGLPTFATIHGGPSEIIVVREMCSAHQPWNKDTSLHLSTAAS